MSEFKIPKFLSKEFNSSTPEMQTELVADYKVWYDKDMTSMWIRGFNARIEDLISQEKKNLLLLVIVLNSNIKLFLIEQSD